MMVRVLVPFTVQGFTVRMGQTVNLSEAEAADRIARREAVPAGLQTRTTP